MGNILNVIGGIIWFILGIAITYKVWFWFPIIADNSPHAFVTVLFWTGVITMFIICVIITPLWLILTGFKDTDTTVE